MSGSDVCPECGSRLPADAPGGLCPKCLLRAGVTDTRATAAHESESSIADRATALGPAPAGKDTIAPALSVELDQFKRRVLELGLMPAAEFERFVTGVLGGVQWLARALVLAGKLTAYQAGALVQGKARGLVIGNYLILDKLGAGGMGVVFKARHRRLGRIVALKILPPTLARDSDLLSRFRREVDVTAKLSHPNIVSVLDADEDRGVQFMTMEYIKGNDLDHLVRDGGVLPVDLALDCTIQAARGLEAAHAQGIVHRDIKPGNLMLDESGVVRVLDLGLARLVEASNPFSDTKAAPLTQSGMYMGTVDFMAPEQGVDSRSVDHRADIYSLGCTLCYLLTGRPPFDGPNVLARLMAHQERPAAALPAARPDVPKAIDAVYQKMMAKKPADRPASMTEVITRLEACRAASGEADSARWELMSFAESVDLKRAAPQGTGRDSSVCERDAPEAVQLSVDVKREDVQFDYQDQPSPAAPTMVPEPEPRPDRIAPAGPGKRASRKAPALVLAAVALLTVGGLGYALLPRKPGAETVDVHRALDSTWNGRSPGSVTLFAERLGTESPGAIALGSTFDVATCFMTSDQPQQWTALAATADGRRAFVGGRTQFPVLLNVDTGHPIYLKTQFQWQGASILDMAMTPDGRRGVLGTYTVGKQNQSAAKAQFWDRGFLAGFDLTSGAALFPKQQPHPGNVSAVAITADGLRALSASSKGDLTLWDVTAGDSVRQLGPQNGGISSHALSFYPDGRRAAAGGQDQLLHVWNLDTGKEGAAWPGHEKMITGLAISPDGHRIVTGGDDGAVILRDADSGEILHRFTMPTDDKGARVAFDPEGNIVAAGNGFGGTTPRPGRLVVWSAESHTVLRQDELPFTRHLAVAALPDGHVLTTDSHGVRLWTPRPPGARPPVPQASRDTKPVDLILQVNASTFKTGVWHTDNGVLISPPSIARFQFPTVPPLEYRLDLEVERVGKDSEYAFGLGILVDGRQTEISIDRKDAKHEKYTGLNGYDGLPVFLSMKVHRGALLAPSRPSRFVVTVRRDSLEVTCDGVPVMDWKGDPRRLIPVMGWGVRDKDKIFLATSSAVKFHKITLTPLSAGSR